MHSHPVHQIEARPLHYTGGYYYPRVVEPQLQTVDYFFARQDVDPFPGSIYFDPANTTPLIIFSGNNPNNPRLAGYAKQAILNGDTNKFAYLGLYFDKAYKVDLNGNVTTNETGILSEYGEFFPTEPGRVWLTTKPESVGETNIGGVLVHTMKLELDVNHDGVIDRSITGPDNTSWQKPFVFWINNDLDLNDKDAYSTDPNLADSGEGRITCARGLEDFARLWISGVPALPAAEGYTVTLESFGPTIRIYDAIDSGIGYLTDTTIASNIVSTSAFRLPRATVSGSSSYNFPANYFNGTDKHFIFEGVEAGEGGLVLTISRNGEPIASTSVSIQLKDIKEMYEHIYVEGVNDSIPIPTQNSSYKIHRPLESNPNESKQIIVWLHGWNNSLWRAQNYAETAFKRLYWQGYTGRFVFVRWPTLSDETTPFPLNLFTYNQSEHKAFHSGNAVSQYFNDLRTKFPDYSINACAHSMGNIVMMEALKRQVGGGFQALDNYVLMEAAVPAHCYDALAPSFSELVDLEAVTATPDVYRDYMNMTNAVRGSLINFFNADDFALNSWIFNQKVRKPHISLGYSSDGTNGFRDSLTIIDPKELMPFVARPRSLAVGAQGATSGAIMDSLDLKVQFGFGGASSDHSGQYLRNFQNVWPFYFSLLDRLNP